MVIDSRRDRADSKCYRCSFFLFRIPVNITAILRSSVSLSPIRTASSWNTGNFRMVSRLLKSLPCRVYLVRLEFALSYRVYWYYLVGRVTLLELHYIRKLSPFARTEHVDRLRLKKWTEIAMIEAGERFADIDVCCQINNLAPNEMLMKIAKPASQSLSGWDSLSIRRVWSAKPPRLLQIVSLRDSADF